jgi:FkbM family methyltransferase
MKSLYRPSLLTGFIAHQRERLLKLCVKTLSRRGEFPKFWLLHGEGICRGISLNGFYELETLKALQFLAAAPASVVIDVGANIGNHTIFFAQRFKQVVSFEPVPENCFIQKANLRLNRINNVTLIEKGLADQNGEFPLGECSPETTNQGICFDPADQSRSTRMVPVGVGDEEVRKIKLTGPIALIKIDVEGAEPLVIKGFKETISKHKPLVCWEAFSHEDANKSVEILRAFGYSHFYHISTRRTGPKFIGRILNNFGKNAFLFPLENHPHLDGMNMASNVALL